MPQVLFIPNNQFIEVEAGISILEAAQHAGLVIETPCNGEGICGKCKVKIDSQSTGHVAGLENDFLSDEDQQQGYVLACNTVIHGDVTVAVPLCKTSGELRILNHGKALAFSLDQCITKRYDPKLNMTKVWAGDCLIGLESQNTELYRYGVVVDIGTTTLVAALIDLNNGWEIGNTSCLNPQALYAQDVLSRIKLASQPEGLELMQASLICDLNRMIEELSSQAMVNPCYIYEVVFSGNTCMLHLAAGVNPESLGKYPYSSALQGGNHIPAANLKMKVAEFGLVYLPHIISAYVGADITSGLLSSQIHKSDKITLLVDIGTNGEMVLSVNGELAATSTAAGPAFEGMNITHGMRASPGAVEFFQIQDDGAVSIKTIGNNRVTGICGSGLLDIVGELVDHGVINKNGKFATSDMTELLPELRERLTTLDKKTAFRISDDVFLTQKDVRQVQLAKGAVRAGIEFLLKTKNINASDVEEILIAGSFGYHLRTESLINIGLLPDEFADKVEFVGNTSKSGGQAFLLNKDFRHEMGQIVKHIDVVELANFEGFDRLFVNCLSF